MASTSETGHAKNIANFQTVIEFVMGYGSSYNPSKNSLKLPALIALKDTAENALTDVVTKNTLYNNKVNDRISAFSGLKTLSTRLINSLQTTDATKETIEDAKSFNRKMQGKRASDKQESTDVNKEAPKTISTSQQSYDQLIQHLTGLKSILESESSYSPNEDDLQVNSLDSLISDLSKKNTEVAKAYTNVSNSRLTRNQTLYTKDDSLVETASEVKKYVKSVFGAKSPQYDQIKGIEFKLIKN